MARLRLPPKGYNAEDRVKVHARAHPHTQPTSRTARRQPQEIAADQPARLDRSGGRAGMKFVLSNMAQAHTLHSAQKLQRRGWLAALFIGSRSSRVSVKEPCRWFVPAIPHGHACPKGLGPFRSTSATLPVGGRPSIPRDAITSEVAKERQRLLERGTLRSSFERYGRARRFLDVARHRNSRQRNLSKHSSSLDYTRISIQCQSPSLQKLTGYLHGSDRKAFQCSSPWSAGASP